MDIITTGRSANIKKKLDELAHKLRMFLLSNEAKYRQAVPFDRVVAEFKSVNHEVDSDHTEFMEAMNLLKSDDLIVLFGQNTSNPQVKLVHTP
jgi:hypothetical protein